MEQVGRVDLTEDNGESSSPPCISTGVSTRGLPPFNLFHPDGSVTGVDVDLLGLAARQLGFTHGPVVVEPVTGAVIPGTGGKEWRGVVGAVKNGSSEIGIGNLALDPARFSVVDYPTLLYKLQTGYISPKPKQTPVSACLTTNKGCEYIYSMESFLSCILEISEHLQAVYPARLGLHLGQLCRLEPVTSADHQVGGGIDEHR